MENNTSVHNWLEEANAVSYKVLECATGFSKTFVATLKGIRNPLSKDDIDTYYKEDPYKGVVATSLWLHKHVLTPREFILLASSRADTIRCQIRYWTKLLEVEGVMSAFYASAGHKYETRKPHGVETSAIFTLSPWELLHFLGYNMPVSNRPPILDIQKHYLILRQIGSEKCRGWYTRSDDGIIVAKTDMMDYIFFDYCLRESSCRSRYHELKVYRLHGYILFYIMDAYELWQRIGLYGDMAEPDATMKLRCHVIAVLRENGILPQSLHLSDYAHTDGDISPELDSYTEKQETKKGLDFIYSKKGISPESPILISCDKELSEEVEERVVLYLTNSSFYIERYENRDIVGIESRIINNELFDVVTTLVQYRDIFGRITSQHLVEWFFKNTFTT